MAKMVYFEMNSWVRENNSDNGGRRKNPDRRQFAYTFHIPERRSGIDRRITRDRRNLIRDREG